MNNKSNIIDIGADFLQNESFEAILSQYLSLGDSFKVDHIQRHLLSLPVLLPHELGQLLDDNDAFIDVIHSLLKVNRAMDSFVYFSRLHDNLTVLMYHHEIYTRSFDLIPLYTSDRELHNTPLINDNDNINININVNVNHDVNVNTNADVDISNVEQNNPAPPSPSPSPPPPPPASFYALNIISLYYIQKQMEKANELIVIYENAGLNLTNSAEMHYHTQMNLDRSIYSPWRTKDTLHPIFHTKPYFSFEQWKNMVQNEKKLYSSHPWYQTLSQANNVDFSTWVKNKKNSRVK